MKFKEIFLIFFLNFVLISAEDPPPVISCSYRISPVTNYYSCDITLNNPEGLDNFESIPGEHVDGQSNDEVIKVEGYNQNSRNIPAVICRQFPNLKDIYLSSSQVSVITQDAFAECTNLEEILLSFNSIEAIPDNIFQKNTHLEYLYLANNNINSVTANSFAGTVISYLDLTSNPLGSFNPQVFAPISNTLKTLQLIANQITELPAGAFSQLLKLTYLSLNGNKFTSIPDDAFAGLIELQMLYLSDCEVSALNPAWFADLQSLDVLHFELNQIEALPDGVFEPLTRLRELYLTSNNITQLGRAAFGGNLEVIESVDLGINPIIAIDREFVELTPNLDTIGLYQSICHSESVYGIGERREQVLSQEIRRCLQNFGPSMAECEYVAEENADYRCDLSIRNPNGQNFETIAGNHVDDTRANSDVLAVQAMEQSTINVPAVLCTQFTALRALRIRSSFLEIISSDDLSSCGALVRLDLSFNNIRNIDANTFSNNPQLTHLNLRSNSILELNADSFAGTAIIELDLSSNRFFGFSSAQLGPISETLEVLDLSENNIQQINENTFENLGKIKRLVLNLNRLTNLEGPSFLGLSSLERLELSSCGLTELNPEWFSALSNLQHLYIANNHLTSLPTDIFSSLTNLQEVFFYANQIVELRAASFGASLPKLTRLYASNNQINIFDPQILADATSLESLLLLGNLCVDINHFNPRGELEAVRESLTQCIFNFDTTPALSCQYGRTEAGGLYRCQLNAMNPLGRDDHEEIEGQHEGNGDNDAVYEVTADNQNTRIIPSIICGRFPNLQYLTFTTSAISEITSRAFNACGRLRNVMIIGNRIKSLPPNTFDGSPRLRYLFLEGNGIEVIDPTAFAGTEIHTLDLSLNRISEYIPATYEAISDSLQILKLSGNRLEILPANAFDKLPHLIHLELNDNHFFSLPERLFAVPAALQTLQIAGCGMTSIAPKIFAHLNSLRDLQLGSNEIDLLPENIFDIDSLVTVGLGKNKLKVLDSAAFGRSLETINRLDVGENEIVAFDPEIFGGFSNVSVLNMEANQCIDDIFTEVRENREAILEQLKDCVDTFNNVPIACEFVDNEGTYECVLSLNNTNDRLRFVSVDGTHLEESDNATVTNIRAHEQSSRTIPSILCRLFGNTEGLTFTSSGLQLISSDSFENCPNLYSLDLSDNGITDIPDGTFHKNPYLSALTLSKNRISALRPGIFEDTSIYFLDVSFNLLTTFSADLVKPVVKQLRYLAINDNDLQRLQQRVFNEFIGLQELIIGGNINMFLHSTAFEELSELNTLTINDALLISLNPYWLRPLSSLERLAIRNNDLRSFPARVFDIPELQHLNFAGNKLSVLDSRIFERSIGKIFSIDGGSNQINAIDRKLLEDATELTTLTLNGNTCVDQDFADVKENANEVLESLSGCFENFSNL